MVVGHSFGVHVHVKNGNAWSKEVLTSMSPANAMLSAGEDLTALFVRDNMLFVGFTGEGKRPAHHSEFQAVEANSG